MNIVITQLGPKKADYLIECVKQLLLFNNKNIYIISTEYHKKLLIKNKIYHKINFFYENEFIKEKKHRLFLKRTDLDKKWFESFWLKTTERFFFVDLLAKKLKLQNIFHLETDNLVYTNLNKYTKIIEKKFNILFTMINSQMCYGNIIYFKSLKETNLFSEFIYQNNKKIFFKNKLNDMELVTNFYKKFKNKKNSLFPISSKEIGSFYNLSSINNMYSSNYNIFKGIFDAAPIGQIVDGVDNNIHKIKGPFINRKYFVDSSALKIKFIKIRNKKRPFLYLSKKIKIPILNLHLHSKNLKKFTSFNKKQN